MRGIAMMPLFFQENDLINFTFSFLFKSFNFIILTHYPHVSKYIVTLKLELLPVTR